jgi:two-component system, LuxR family, response regulator FixJ
MTSAPGQAIYIIDDDASVRDSLEALFSSVRLPTRTFASAEAFLEALDANARGCLLIDVRMPGMSGLQLQRVLVKRQIRLPVIMLTGHGDVPMAVQAMKAGATDFIQKPFSDQYLLDRVRECLKTDRQAVEILSERQRAAERIARLTPREHQVMELMIEGKQSKVISSALGISERTVDVHRHNVMKKTGTRSVAELIYLSQKALGSAD